MITPYVNDEELKNDKKLLTNFYKILNYFDNSQIKELFGNIALKVVKNGCYYGYVVDNITSVQVQELPIKYCRSRFNVCGKPAIEFNMRYFDDKFKDAQQKMKVLNLFPKKNLNVDIFFIKKEN